MSHPKVYLVRGGKNGEDETAALDNNLAIIGFRDIPSLVGAKTLNDIKILLKKIRPEAKPQAVNNFAGQLFTFANAMEPGDLVVMPLRSTGQIALGLVNGGYDFANVGGHDRHTRRVVWKRTDVPRTAFEQDLLYSLGAFMTVCRISRNDAERRVSAVLAGKSDPGVSTSRKSQQLPVALDDEIPNLAQVAHDQIVAHIQTRFAGHALATLVDAILRADGWVTKLSPPGPDGGVDILGGRGPLGLDGPKLVVQVKSQNTPADVTIYGVLKGAMSTFNASQGLLVCWGGFTQATLRAAHQDHFSIRLWNSTHLVQAIYQTYDRLPAEIQADLPLKRVWMLLPEEPES